MLLNIIYIFIFPGFLFLFVLSLAAEYYDRKLHARLQNRVGPPWFQPLADFIKLLAKSEVVTEEADRRIFILAPLVALVAVTTAYLYIPLWTTSLPVSFNGDLIVILYLLTLPTLTFFLGGWYSRSLYSALGAIRAITQLFAYEIPLLLSILAPAIIANTWSLAGIVEYYLVHPWHCLFNLGAFFIALIALLGKLEKVPFDIPEAETEIVAGSFTEYSGRFLAYFRLAIDCEVVVGASLLAAVFLPFGQNQLFLISFCLYLVKILIIIGLLTVLRTIFARLRIDQMINLCWKIIAPLAFAQVLFNLIVKEFLVR